MSCAAPLRAALSTALLVALLLAGVVPSAAAEPADPAAPTEVPAPVADDAATDGAQPAVPAPELPTEAPTEPPAPAPVEPDEPDGTVDEDAVDRDAVDDDAVDADAVDDDAVDEARDDREEPGDGTDADTAADVRAEARGPRDADEADDADAAAVPDPADIQVVELDADAFCELLADLGEELDLGDLSGDPNLQAAPGTVLPDVDSAAYRGLLEAVDAVLARYADALLVSATYDGTSLVVTVVPDLSGCEALDGLPLPEPADDLDDVEVVVTVITEDDVCAALEDLEGADPSTDPEPGGPLPDLEDLFDLRTGDQLSPEELADVTGLGAELDAVLADNPEAGVVSVTYDGAVLAVVIGPDPTAALDCEEPVEATPIADTDDDADDDDRHQVLAATGLDTPRQAGAGLAAVLLGAVLVALGRTRYRGVHREA